MMMTSEIVDCGGDYCVHPSEDGHTWSVVNGPTGTVRCSCGSRDEAIRLARELNEQSDDEETGPQGTNEDIGDWEPIDTCLKRCFGRDGDELGEVPVSVAPYTVDQPCTACDGRGYDLDDDETCCDECGGEGTIEASGWIVAETPDEATEYHGRYATREEAVAAAEALAEELDETPDLAEIVADIQATGYFDDPDIVPAIVAAATQYSQGYLLLTPDVHQPIGTRWTTNGYLQCDRYITLDATYGTQEQAAEALLRAINEPEPESESETNDED